MLPTTVDQGVKEGRPPTLLQSDDTNIKTHFASNSADKTKRLLYLTFCLYSVQHEGNVTFRIEYSWINYRETSLLTIPIPLARDIINKTPTSVLTWL